MAICHLSVKPSNKQRTRSAKGHAQYICREGKYHALYLVREGKYQSRAHELEAVEHGNMPVWAEGKPMSFWEAADTHERANGRVYNELEVSLPRELSKEKRQELGREFARQELGDRYAYTLAFHCSKALDGEENPHIHLMFSERRLDGIERGPEQFFKRHNPEHPEQGGARKERMYWRPADVENLRGRWAGHVNRALEREGIEARIDHRSYKRQGIDREPEPKLGPAVTKEIKEGRVRDTAAEVLEVRQYRKLEAERVRLEQEIGAEKAKVYNLEEERAKRVYTLEADPQENREEQGKRAAKYRQEEERLREENPKYHRTVDLICNRVETARGVEYRFKRSDTVAFVDLGQKIEVYSRNEKAILAVAQVAKEKGWETVRVIGDEQFRRQAWLELKLQGMEVTGYEAKEADLKELGRRTEEREQRREKYRRKAKEAAIREYPSKQVELREKAERGVFSESADKIVARFRDEILPRLDSEHRELWAQRKALGLVKDPSDRFGQKYVYSPTDDSKITAARQEVERRFERVKIEIEQGRLLQRSCRELGKERVTAEWTQGKRSLRATNPDELDRQVKRAREMEKARSRGRGMDFDF